MDTSAMDTSTMDTSTSEGTAGARASVSVGIAELTRVVQGDLACAGSPVDIKAFVKQLVPLIGEVRKHMRVCVNRPDYLRYPPKKMIHTSTRFSNVVAKCLRDNYTLSAMDKMVQAMDQILKDAQQLRHKLKQEEQQRKIDNADVGDNQ